jgi:23S rRNA pseudouridine1911/1915/1917 synthase
LVNWVLYHCKDNLPSIWWVERPWIIHRLDKDTTWVILVAKTDKMMIYLSDIIKDRKIEKHYIAIVSWLVKDKKFKIESHIGRHPFDKIKMTVTNPMNPKIAITYWEVIDYIDDKYTLLKVKIETWRTHQIRVHLAYLGHPIIWDRVYWNEKINEEVKKKYWLTRQALHAYSLEFDLYGEKRRFVWELKDDMKKIIWEKNIF